MNMSYQYVSPELRVFHGEDCLAFLQRDLARAGVRRAVVVCGRTVGRSAELQLLRDALGDLLAGISPSAREHSPVAGVEEAAQFMEAVACDAIVAVGGGSAVVTARAAAIRLGEKRPIAELSTRRLPDGKFESPRLNAPKLPVYAVPTTPSTAFAKAGTAVHGEDGTRLAMFDPKTRARAIFIHPAFVTSAPVDLVRTAALNAFTNAVEALESPLCDPFSEALLMQALRMIRRRLSPGGIEDLESRAALVAAAVLCGRGTEQGGTGLTSVLAHAIGARAHVANGIVGSIVLPHTMRYNAPVTGIRASALLEALSPGSPHSADVAPADLVSALLANLPGPHNLRGIGIASGDLGAIAEAAMKDWFISRNARPVKDVLALIEVLESAL
ncbi:MAG: iron-containing alcohol dehydrogenase [Rhodoferax sp.]|nr:iron-containing alcohol dehydrogenase [Rhodoferax sp.]